MTTIRDTTAVNLVEMHQRVGLAMLGFKLFDLLTPGKLEEEIVQKQNIAAAILGGAIVVGICIIVARTVG